VSANVAIIMRTRDRPVFLRRAIDDVLTQDFQNWQLVVVNDGGDAALVAAELARQESRLAGRAFAIHNPTSLGMPAATNAGIAASDSTYVVVHDDDDSWAPEFLTRTTAWLEDPSCQDDGVVARTEMVFEEMDSTDSIVETNRMPFWPEIHEISLLEAFIVNHAVPISFVYRRKVHGEIGLYNESLKAVDDWEFQLRFLATHSIGFLDGAPLAFWHLRPASSGSAGNSMYENARDHRHFDLQVREEPLRQWIDQYGTGLPLLIGLGMRRREDERAQDLDRYERELDAARAQYEDLRQMIERSTVIGRMRSIYWKWRSRYTNARSSGR
jgi:glycosyltransferase involved in cell wall biosynthesis